MRVRDPARPFATCLVLLEPLHPDIEPAAVPFGSPSGGQARGVVMVWTDPSAAQAFLPLVAVPRWGRRVAH